jgi:hypothetical protein
MKTGPDALANAEKESGRAKHENGTKASSVPPTTIPATQNMKTGLDVPVPPKMSPGAQNMKRGPITSISPKMSPGAKNMKKVPHALVTAENESGSAKHENETRHPQYRRKRVRERKT